MYHLLYCNHWENAQCLLSAQWLLRAIQADKIILIQTLNGPPTVGQGQDQLLNTLCVWSLHQSFQGWCEYSDFINWELGLWQSYSLLKVTRLSLNPVCLVVKLLPFPGFLFLVCFCYLCSLYDSQTIRTKSEFLQERSLFLRCITWQLELKRTSQADPGTNPSGITTAFVTVSLLFGLIVFHHQN